MSSIFADEQMYKKYSEQDWKVKDSFSYDGFQVFNDQKILKIQNIRKLCLTCSFWLMQGSGLELEVQEIFGVLGQRN